jgi:hypothetical protein
MGGGQGRVGWKGGEEEKREDPVAGEASPGKGEGGDGEMEGVERAEGVGGSSHKQGRTRRRVARDKPGQSPTKSRLWLLQDFNCVAVFPGFFTRPMA